MKRWKRAANHFMMSRIAVGLCCLVGSLVGSITVSAQELQRPVSQVKDPSAQDLLLQKVSLKADAAKNGVSKNGGGKSNVAGKRQASRDVDALEGLKQLKEGNQRFVSGKPRHPHENTAWRHLLEAGQHPFAVVLGCSDSRVPPELIFDQGFGDLFVVRVAGNVVDTDVTASVEYAIDHLDTQLIVVLGHSHCGAVTATLDHLTSIDDEPAEVVSLLYRIEPAIVGIDAKLPRQERIDCAVKKNVELAVRRLSRVPDLRRSIDAGKIKIVGAVYDMHTGKIDFQD